MNGVDDHGMDPAPVPGGDDLDELLAALALDAVDAEERAELEALLGSESEGGNRAAASRYAAAADHLVDAVEPVAPSAGLWAQLSSQLDTVQSTLPVPEEPQDELAARRAQRGWTPVTTLVAAAAVVLVVLISGAALLVVNQRSTGSQDLMVAAQEAMVQPGSKMADLTPTEYGPGMHAQVVVAADNKTYFVGDGLPPLTADRAYQLWSVDDQGVAVSVGVLGSDPQVTMLSMGSQPGLLAVTVEPATGSATATTNPIVAGKLA